MLRSQLEKIDKEYQELLEEGKSNKLENEEYPKEFQ
jgi:hypothetical protein